MKSPVLRMFTGNDMIGCQRMLDDEAFNGVLILKDPLPENLSEVKDYFHGYALVHLIYVTFDYHNTFPILYMTRNVKPELN